MWNDKLDQVRFGREARMSAVMPELISGPTQTLTAKRRPEDLTRREHEILQLVWSGLTNRVIAEQLHISIKTAEAHRANMMKKLRVSNIAQLLKTALEEGLLATRASKSDSRQPAPRREVPLSIGGRFPRIHLPRCK